MVRSYYYHPDSCHGSTVVYNSEQLRSVDTPPGKTSAAEKEPSIFHGLMMPITIEYANNQSV
ncbi:lactococcin 972 family bacteriocin [Parageobacillus thermoglucosidasius]|uniref:lactococcin 972 family bacteriocin n=1 Tax=Parageobacillus thermoglucosidasius TaxID=1426 RepID=UPI0021AB116D|nr:lactococcin 972 family bacteriocin [Parageobacillus thermoglucosidasius]MED4904002.1 lactococcin 972 family bacteriocin [Parageobacillus thermoglucosidasius]MED4914096.1 lactococcin 972 family bacteriocin [Parageobacillus thermoglucosidasius]MED4946795.1 lactococcin 972 family bacteriocin [Parageobacillus thermoglucosidasius]MED4982948.1 lactococcin 972 family bacteriocin [Parageobacillus thermoglucosidasius]